MMIVEKLPTYGIHYYEVKNKQGIAWWLGLSFKGIAQYEYIDKRTPRRVSANACDLTYLIVQPMVKR